MKKTRKLLTALTAFTLFLSSFPLPIVFGLEVDGEYGDYSIVELYEEETDNLANHLSE